MAILPDDILINIFSLLPQNTILQCRFLSRTAGSLATSLAFRRVRLEISSNPSPFICISSSPTLRTLVREITIDASDHQLATESPYAATRMFLHTTQALLALPRLRLFSALQTLNLRFTRFDDDGKIDQQVAVLDTIVRCTTGQWTDHLQENWHTSWLARFENLKHAYPGFDESTSPLDGQGMNKLLLPFSPTGRLLHLSSLTIANLTGFSAKSIHERPEFQSWINSNSFTELKLLLSTQHNHSYAIAQTYPPEEFEFFEKLPTTWLSPALCSNLRVLSLCRHDYFGWVPKLDFRMLNSDNKTSALPNLRVLALGKFVFCQEWQVEWITSLGLHNGRGGLEELYLDDCPIMWRAHVRGPMDESISVVNGRQIDNSGFPLKEMMIPGNAHGEDWDPVTVKYHLRWSTVLQIWRNKMTALKVFRMGSGDWDSEHAEDVASARTRDLCWDSENISTSLAVWTRRCQELMHLNYDKPSLAECLQYDDSDAVLQDGLGLTQSREALLQYIHFHVGLGWVERDDKSDMMNEYEDGWQRYEASRRADEEALQELQEAIANRT